jgi:hypothetical protein
MNKYSTTAVHFITRPTHPAKLQNPFFSTFEYMCNKFHGVVHEIGEKNHTNLVVSQIEAGLIGHGLQAVLLHRLEGLRAETQPHKALALLPPEPLVLQVGLLQMLCSLLGERHLVPIVGLLAC